jgi:UDP-glucose 6-dehydrogenase
LTQCGLRDNFPYRIIHFGHHKYQKRLENEPRLGKSHFDVFYQGYRGFGGKCLPKDLKALISHYKKLKLSPKFFETVWRINFQYLKKQKLLKRLSQDWLKNQS